MIRNFYELWRYRTLIWALVIRHLSMRYRGSALGFLWSFLNPLFLMLIYTVVFKYYMRFDVDNYSIFLFCGLLPWIWVTSAIAEGTSAVVSSGHLITKSMFPAHVLPTVSVITNMIHFLLALPLLFIFILLAGMPIHSTLLGLPLVILLEFLLLEGCVLFCSALNVKYRDVQHIVGNLLTFLFFLCPILYPMKQIPEGWAWHGIHARTVLELNPFAAITICYHNLVLEGVWPEWQTLLPLLVFVFIALWLGNYVFNHCREGFAEML